MKNTLATLPQLGRKGKKANLCEGKKTIAAISEETMSQIMESSHVRTG